MRREFVRQHGFPLTHFQRNLLSAMLAIALGALGVCASPTKAEESRSVRAMFEDVDTPQQKPKSVLESFLGAFGRDKDDAQKAPSQPPPRAPANPRPRAIPTLQSYAPEQLPPGEIEGRVPLAGSDAAGNVHLSTNDQGLITLIVRDASLSKVLSLLAQTYELNIVAANDIDAIISITLRDVPLNEALTAILDVANYSWVQRNNIILVTSVSEADNLPPSIQGTQVAVFDLDYASASEVAEAVREFLSPAGKVHIHESDPADDRRTRELVIVQDYPESLARIANYIHQVDQPPRQVLIEAHILQVSLSDELKNGVNFAALFRAAGANASIISVPGLASITLPTPDNPTPTPPQTPAFLATVASTDFASIVELLQKTSDAKTLGSPRILVLNEQTAKINVGEEIGYPVTTTTETSSLESTEFLQTGVILTITPRITRENRVLLKVKPEVSTGQINPTTQLPDKELTNLETTVLLNDGEGMIIGGLINEDKTDDQTKVPYLGDLWKIGFLFQSRTRNKERTEIIVALVPRVQPYDPEWQAFEQGELARTGVPLFKGPLCPTNRSWEPELPNPETNPRGVFPLPCTDQYYPPLCRPKSPYYVPRKPLPQQRFYEYGTVITDQCDQYNQYEEPVPAMPLPSEARYPYQGDQRRSFNPEFVPDRTKR